MAVETWHQWHLSIWPCYCVCNRPGFFPDNPRSSYGIKEVPLSLRNQNRKRRSSPGHYHQVTVEELGITVENLRWFMEAKEAKIETEVEQERTDGHSLSGERSGVHPYQWDKKRLKTRVLSTRSFSNKIDLLFAFLRCFSLATVATLLTVSLRQHR